MSKLSQKQSAFITLLVIILITFGAPFILPNFPQLYDSWAPKRTYSSPGTGVTFSYPYRWKVSERSYSVDAGTPSPYSELEISANSQIGVIIDVYDSANDLYLDKPLFSSVNPSAQEIEKAAQSYSNTTHLSAAGSVHTGSVSTNEANGHFITFTFAANEKFYHISVQTPTASPSPTAAEQKMLDSLTLP